MFLLGDALQLLVQHRHQRFAPLIGQGQPVERRREHLRRRGFQVEEEAQRFGQIQIGEVDQHRTVDAPVEEARQDRFLQQVLAVRGIQVENGARQLGEEHAGETGLGRSEDGGHFGELLRERQVTLPGRDRVLAGQPHQHRRDFRRVIDNDRQIDERDGFERDGRIHPDPALVRRVEMVHLAAGERLLLSPQPFVVDELGGGRGRRADLEHLRPIHHARLNCRHAVIDELLRERHFIRRRSLDVADVNAKPREIANRRAAIERDLSDVSAVELANQFTGDRRRGREREVTDEQLGRRDAEGELVLDGDGAERLVARRDDVQAQRARRRVDVELVHRAGEELDEPVRPGKFRGARPWNRGRSEWRDSRGIPGGGR